MIIPDGGDAREGTAGKVTQGDVSRVAEEQYDALRRRRGEGMYTPLRAMLTRHVCGIACTCPVHGTPLIYWPAGDDHACQDITCKYGHGGAEGWYPP